MKLLFDFWRGGKAATLPTPLATVATVEKPRQASRPGQARGIFAAAIQTRYSQWQISLEAAHKEIQRSLVALRAHSRELVRDNPHAARYMGLVATHIVGPHGVMLESEITGNSNKPKVAWNELIEEQWAAWGRACTVDGHSHLVEFTQLVATTTAMDGECFIHLVRDRSLNAWGLGLELIDADRVDWTWNQPINPQTGQRTIMGVTIDRFGRPVGYWMWSAHPLDYEGAPRRIFVPATEIIHVYDERRTRSTRGIPWMTNVMVPLSMLQRLINSELSAANWDATRIAQVKGPAPDVDDDGKLIQREDSARIDPYSTAKGIQNEIQQDDLLIVGMDPGTEMTFPNANHPNPHLTNFAMDLRKTIASGLEISYHRMTSDVANANYNAGNLALMDEKDTWEMKQAWFIRAVMEPIFRAWLEMAVVSGAVSLPVLDWQRLCAPKWWPRTWDPYDKVKDATAAILYLRAGLTTRQRLLGSMGQNWRKVDIQIAAEQAHQRETGAVIVYDTAKASSNAPSDLAQPEVDPTEAPTPEDPQGGKDASA